MDKKVCLDLDKLEKDLEPSLGDHIHSLVKIIISGVPEVGGPATELFNALVTPPLEKRRDKWIKLMAYGLSSVIDKENLDIEVLLKNESFLTTLIYASRIAIQNHQEEKLDALRNAVLNSALYNSPGEDMEIIFLNIIDKITSWHLIVLYYLNNPGGDIPCRIKPISNVTFLPEINPTRGGTTATTNLQKLIFDSFPEIKVQKGLCAQIFVDLNTLGLIRTDTNGLYTTETDNHYITSCVTEMGKQFINYISKPIITNTKSK